MTNICRMGIGTTNIVEGLTVGILAGLCIIYAFQTRNAFPRWLISLYDKPWLILILLSLAVLLYKYSRRISVLLIILIISMCIEVYIFTKKEGMTSLQVDYTEYDNLVEENIQKPFTDDKQNKSTKPLDIVDPIYPVFYGLNQVPDGYTPIENILSNYV